MPPKTLPFGRISEDWSDRPVWVVGGGPSLVGFDFQRIARKGHHIIGANRGAIRCGVASHMATIDVQWARAGHAEIMEFVEGGGTAFLAVPALNDNKLTVSHHPRVVYLKRQRGDGMATDPGALHGLNSGFAAMNAAFLMGAREVNLLGFDMGYSGGKSHFHEGYVWHRPRQDRCMHRWAADFTGAAAQFAQAGVSVTNWIGPEGSNLVAFEECQLEYL